MKTKFFAIILTGFMVATGFSQTSINNYKYVIVPKKFDFLKEKDQYQLNSLTQFLFNKYGFKAVMQGSDYPQDLANNRCEALNSEVTKEPGMFKTKLKIVLTDCNDKVVYTSEIGESREKEYKTAYNLAIREAFKSIEALNYKYAPNNNLASVSAPSQNQAKAEVTKVKTPKVVVPEPVIKKQVMETTVIEGTSNVLYAQAIANGYQLVDSSPKVIYRIKKTNLKDVYLVEGKSALVYKKGNDWVIEYYSEGVLLEEALNIKF